MVLEGHVAIVTGAARGMGEAISRALAVAGAQVLITDVSLEHAQLAADGINHECNTGMAKLAQAAAMDVTSAEQVNHVVGQAIAQFGAVSILVNNAGILYPTRFAELSCQEWQRVLDVNLTGTFLCCKAVLPHMRAAGFGRIVNMSSSAGRSVSTMGGAHYTAAKAGVLGLTRALARETAEEGVLVNAICPGLIDTAMVRDTISQAQINAYENSFPIKRLRLPAEVADVVVFLCTTGSYITGASIDVNGGDLML